MTDDTGHRTVEVVMKHYFRQGREDFRQTILKAMPRMLREGGQRSVKEEMPVVPEGRNVCRSNRLIPSRPVGTQCPVES